jgi:hypothetical protein
VDTAAQQQPRYSSGDLSRSTAVVGFGTFQAEGPSGSCGLAAAVVSVTTAHPIITRSISEKKKLPPKFRSNPSFILDNETIGFNLSNS